MASYREIPHQDSSIPIPAAYARQLSYDVTKTSPASPHSYVEMKRDLLTTRSFESDNLKPQDGDEDNEVSTGKERTSVLIFLRNSRIYIRVLAILIMIVSFSLILTAVIMFARAQKDPHSLDSVPKKAPITDQPCIVFTGVAGMNLVISISVLSLSCISSKFRKSNNAVNAVFAIISAVGFSTSMGACFYLNKQTSLQNDLWKWSCQNHKSGLSSDALNFNIVCHVVSYGWRFGLAQASLELLTFVVSITAFVLMKYTLFARYGRVGKVF